MSAFLRCSGSGGIGGSWLFVWFNPPPLGDTFCCTKAGGEIVVASSGSGIDSSGFGFVFSGIIVFTTVSLSPRAKLLSADFEFFSLFSPPFFVSDDLPPRRPRPRHQESSSNATPKVPLLSLSPSKPFSRSPRAADVDSSFVCSLLVCYSCHAFKSIRE